MQLTEVFYIAKIKYLRKKYIFLIFAQNIDGVPTIYVLEQRKGRTKSHLFLYKIGVKRRGYLFHGRVFLITKLMNTTESKAGQVFRCEFFFKYNGCLLDDHLVDIRNRKLIKGPNFV